jgi:hypothetical protein
MTSISLSQKGDFRDSVSALENKPININDRNFLRLSQLSEEFGFQSLSKKFSAHRRSPGLSSAQTAECLSHISVLEERTVEGIPLDEFTFTLNDKVFPTSTVEAVLLSPAVGEQLHVDDCVRGFDICASKIDSTDFSLLRSLLSGKEISLRKSHLKSLILLSGQLWRVDSDRLSDCVWGDYSTVDAAVTLSSAFAAHSRVYLHSVRRPTPRPR